MSGRYEEIDDELDESNIGNEINNFNFNNANDIGNAPEEIPEFDSQRIDNDKPYTTHTYLYKPITTTRNRRNIRLRKQIDYNTATSYRKHRSPRPRLSPRLFEIFYQIEI
ncbi:12034_t:CDS:2 [Entrophospora sp. SA101]|nr:12034_t:CDS:2 [Entrophospora sp. SA101]